MGGPLKILSKQAKDNELLPWTSIGFVLELYLDLHVLRLEDLYWHALTTDRIRRIAVKKIPKFTETLCQIIAILQNQSDAIDKARTNFLAMCVSAAAAAGPTLARIFVTESDQILLG